MHRRDRVADHRQPVDDRSEGLDVVGCVAERGHRASELFELHARSRQLTFEAGDAVGRRARLLVDGGQSLLERGEGILDVDHRGRRRTDLVAERRQREVELLEARAHRRRHVARDIRIGLRRAQGRHLCQDAVESLGEEALYGRRVDLRGPQLCQLVGQPGQCRLGGPYPGFDDH